MSDDLLIRLAISETDLRPPGGREGGTDGRAPPGRR
jgi:hypothetical protein